MTDIWVLLLSDLHLGSAFALWPPDMISSSGAKLNLNVGQEYLWRSWIRIREGVWKLTDGKGPDIVCEVGDSIQGKNKKGDGEFIIEPSTAFQGRAAIEVIQTIKPADAVFYKFRGSRYHVGSQAETEEWVGAELGGVTDDLGYHCWSWMPSLDIEGVILDIAHHQSAVQVNRSMPLERERRYSNQIAEPIKPKPHLIVRAHGHVSAYVEVDGEASLGLHPLKLQDDFAKMSRVPNRYLTKYLGVHLIQVMPELLGTMLTPFIVHPLRFMHPPLSKRQYRRDADGRGNTRLHNGRLVT